MIFIGVKYLVTERQARILLNERQGETPWPKDAKGNYIITYTTNNGKTWKRGFIETIERDDENEFSSVMYGHIKGYRMYNQDYQEIKTVDPYEMEKLNEKWKISRGQDLSYK